MIQKAKNMFITYALAATVVFLLCGCSNSLKETLGLVERGPDEFTVVSNPELEIPEDFDLPKPHGKASEKKKGKIYYREASNEGLDEIDIEILQFENSGASIELNSNLDSADHIFLQDI